MKLQFGFGGMRGRVGDFNGIRLKRDNSLSGFILPLHAVFTSKLSLINTNILPRSQFINANIANVKPVRGGVGGDFGGGGNGFAGGGNNRESSVQFGLRRGGSRNFGGFENIERLWLLVCYARGALRFGLKSKNHTSKSNYLGLDIGFRALQLSRYSCKGTSLSRTCT